MQQEDGYTGCILGQAVGDALGFMVEGYPPAICRDYVDKVIRAEQMPEGDRAGFPFGQYSDDTQLARTLMESFVARRAFDPADFAQRLAALFNENRVVGRGRATEQAAFRLVKGVSWEESGEPTPSAGNGSAMRAGPIGLFFPDDPEARRRAAHDQSRLTHQDLRCSAGSAIIAEAVAWGVRGAQLDVPGFLGDLAAAAGAYDPQLNSCLGRMPGWLELPPDRALSEMVQSARCEMELTARAGVTPYVVTSVLWSLYAFLRSPEDYMETLCVAIAVGGDVDTTAAMAGAISGAYNGASALPGFYLTMLNDQGQWGEHALRDLGRQVQALVQNEAGGGPSG